MENRARQTVTRDRQFAGTLDRSIVDDERLNWLVYKNEQVRRERQLFRTDREKRDAESMQTPITSRTAYAFFGFLLGFLPVFSIFAKIIIEAGGVREENGWLSVLILAASVGTAVAAFFTGRTVARIVERLDSVRWSWYLTALPFIGLLWGAVSGAVGGVFLFIIGSVFGAVIGGMIGALALPVFGALHRALKRGDLIELKHFLPLSFGIVLFVCAFILGL